MCSLPWHLGFEGLSVFSLIHHVELNGPLPKLNAQSMGPHALNGPKVPHLVSKLLGGYRKNHTCYSVKSHLNLKFFSETHTWAWIGSVRLSLGSPVCCSGIRTLNPKGTVMLIQVTRKPPLVVCVKIWDNTLTDPKYGIKCQKLKVTRTWKVVIPKYMSQKPDPASLRMKWGVLITWTAICSW